MQYKKVKEEEEIIRAAFGGVVTEIMAGVGDRIPDTAVMLISDETLPCQLKVTLDKDQKKYIGLGDTLLVKVDGKSKEMEIELDYLAESKNAPGQYEALVTLPQECGIPGMSGAISRTQAGEKYRLCIPASALHEKDKQSFVYLLRQREGILGNEYYVDEVNVKVLDQNENWAAIEEGVVDKDSEIVLSTTKEVKRGETVRWQEE